MTNITQYHKLFPSNAFVGFDKLLDELKRVDHSEKYPPYSIYNTVDENHYVVEFALAGFAPENIKVTLKDDKLVVEGKVEEKVESYNYSHKGISTKSFTRAISIDKDIEVKNVTHKHGILKIELERAVPEKQEKVLSITVLK